MNTFLRSFSARRAATFLSLFALTIALSISADEPRRPSAEEERQVADALARALERSDYAKKRQAAGLADIGDADFAGFMLKRSAEQWRRLLSPGQFRVSQEKAAEPSALAWQASDEPGIYRCICGQPLFQAQAVIASETALARFHAAIEPGAIVTDITSEWSHDHEKVELLCGMCGSHLGHVDPGHDAAAPLTFRVKPTALVFDLASAPK